MDQSKRALRVAALSKRDSLPFQRYETLSRSIQDRVLGTDFYRFANVVTLYSSVRNEVSTEIIRGDALRSGKAVFYPRMGPGHDGQFVQIQTVDELASGKSGILEPTGGKLLDHSKGINRLLVVVPGVAFDLSGNRLGWGRGWYDRVLRKLGAGVMTVGLAYEFQLVDSMAVDPWDEKVQYIVTEKRIIEFQKISEQTKAVC